MSHIVKKDSPSHHRRKIFTSPNVYLTAYMLISFCLFVLWFLFCFVLLFLSTQTEPRLNACNQVVCDYWCADFSFTLLSICPV